MNVGVYVGDGVLVPGVEVGVSVGVDVGIAAAVCDAAAFAVCAMKRLILAGSTVGAGVPRVGMQASINARDENQSRMFCLRGAIVSLPHPEDSYFSTAIAAYG